ncbi:ATP/GTP-binding protein [Cellulophaga sp. HaHa_2_1]|uniref:AAA family ATPase n=1 Tax=Cellulophaga sp. HaHa_2_1 TaxID=2749994 RepID=UPI001C4EDB8B|nr:AAA family ATPase [Cellulophaga sp. HaHa_2_1]QXP52544.1 ATP-binding protein [Cellulophaga sp. HaHa_2_1]
MSSNRIKRHLDRLILDPNNYRFIDRPDYKLIAEEDLADTRIQQRTYNFLLGKNNSNINDLTSSFTTNGFLDIDQIQVKAVGDKYLVLEGNRRTATLKYLYDQFKEGKDVGKLTEADFKSINIVEIIDENPVQHLISMGLHHISGKKRWNAVNESQLVNDLIETYGKSETEVCDALGISMQKLRRSRRTLFLIKQYKISDFGDQFEANKFTIFETIIASPIMKTWIGWNDTDYEATNIINLEKLFSWISQTEEIDKDDDGVERSSLKEPIISQYRQIKELAEFVNDNQAVKRMEESRSITEGYSYSDAIGENRLKNALNSIKSEVNVAFNFSEHLTQDDYLEVERLKVKLDRLIPSSEASIVINDNQLSKYFTTITNHFESAFIHRYRKLEKVKIKKLSKVNIFAGGNNMGKTSLLETFYLLSQLNDLNAFLSLEKYRGKFQNDFLSKWISKNFINEIELEGIFNNVGIGLTIQKELTEDNIEKSGYLSSLSSEATIGKGAILESSIHLYSNKEAELRFSKSQILCPATFTSPFRSNINLLKKAHAFAVKEGFIDEVIAFIKEHLDNSIEKIEMIDEDGESRFMVSSSSIGDKPIDITKYGEGLQRVFEIALLMGYSQNGIVCIDELDSAIHKSLLVQFTKFIQQTAQKFNVQVFLSTHSKECIDAFVKNDYHNNEITAYALVNDEDNIKCKYIEGSRLEQLVETINFDIR